MRTALSGVEVDAAGDIARLHDISGHLGAANLAPYFARAGTGAF